MRRKVRIFSTIVSLALVLAVMCVGIWAASKRHVKSTGTLTFNPTDVNATVAFADAGGTKQVNFGQESYSFDETTTAESHSVTFTFAEANKTTDTWVFTVTVTNTFAAGSDITIDSKLTATVSAESNFEVKIKVGEKDSPSNRGRHAGHARGLHNHGFRQRQRSRKSLYRQSDFFAESDADARLISQSLNRAAKRKREANHEYFQKRKN